MADQLSLWNDRPPTPTESPYQKPPRTPLTLRELPESERPLQRLNDLGPAALSTTELLAILLGHAHQLHDAASLLSTFDDLAGVARAPSTELQQQPGIGAAAAARIRAALELGRRLAVERSPDRPQIRTPADAATLLMAEMGLLDQEQMRIILLDTKNRVVAIPTLYVGSVNTTLIRIAEVFREAVRRNCPSIIVVHNHPSQDVSPSPEDVTVTRQIVEAGKLLDIMVLDHLIVARQGFTSLKERGLGFS